MDSIECLFCRAPVRCDYYPAQTGELEVTCESCGRSFLAMASVTVSYTAACLNWAHDWGPCPQARAMQTCKRCGQVRAEEEKVPR